MRQDRADPVGTRHCVLVLPEPEDRPAESSEVVVRLTVPRDVLRELLGPPAAVRHRGSPVLGAGVPEAPVDEHRQATPGERDVGASTSHPGQGQVHAKPKTSPVQLTPERHLGRSITSGLSGHAQ
jgi:hypothetical protein